MDVCSIRKRNHGREDNTRGEESERICTRAPPKRVGRALALLTKTYHGRVIGNWPTAKQGQRRCLRACYCFTSGYFGRAGKPP
jgi:hypothetical protein